MVHYVVVGGGVAGVCTAEELCRLCPADCISLVSADRVLKGVSTVVRITRILEEVRVEEKSLDSLPYPNLELVQGVAAGIDTQGKRLLLADREPLTYDKLCICAGAKPRELPVSSPAAASGRVVTLRDTDSVSRLAAELEGARRVVVVGNGGIALQLIHGLRGVDVVWAMKHGHIGDAFFDLDAAQFLLEELQQQRESEAQQLAEANTQQQPEQQQLQLQQGPGGENRRPPGQRPEQQQQQQLAECESRQPSIHQQQRPPPDAEWGPSAGQTASQAAAPPSNHEQQQVPQQEARVQATRGRPQAARPTLGHAVGPTWVQHLQHLQRGVGGPGGRVTLEYGCELASIELQESTREQLHQQQQPLPAQAAGTEGPGPPTPQGAAPGPQAPAGGGSSAFHLLVTLTNGKQVAADLVVAAIGVDPALDWVPPQLARAPDGGLAVNKLMQTSDPCIFAAGDSCSAAWALEESPHWFQMRLWSQARNMGLHAAACMAGKQEDTGASMAFEMFTHVTRFLGRKVVLLGLYNGQRLEHESPDDMVSYSRITEGATHHHGGCCRPGPSHTRQQHPVDEGRTFVRVLLLRGRVQGAVLIGETDLEETFENLILDQLDVGAYGPSLLDPEVELDHVFD